MMNSSLMHEPAHLAVENITVGYNGRPALQDMSFQVLQGTRVAVVGPNGAGKSTLFKALVGLLPLKQGQILVHGLPLGNAQGMCGVCARSAKKSIGNFR